MSQGDALALAVKGEGDVVGERDENRVVDVHVKLFAQHLDDVLGNRQVDDGNGLDQAGQPIEGTGVVGRGLAQGVGLLDGGGVDDVAGVAAKAQAPADHDKLGAVVGSDHRDVIVENALDYHSGLREGLLGKPADGFFGGNGAGGALAQRGALGTLARDYEDRGVEAGGADGRKVDLDDRLARIDVVALGDERLETLAVKLHGVDADVHHDLGGAIVGRDGEGVAGWEKRGDRAGNGSEDGLAVGVHGNAVAHGSATENGICGFLQGNKFTGNGGEDFELGGLVRLLASAAHQTRKEAQITCPFINQAQPRLGVHAISITTPTDFG